MPDLTRLQAAGCSRGPYAAQPPAGRAWCRPDVGQRAGESWM